MKGWGDVNRRVGVLGGGEVVRSHHLPVLLAAGVDVAWVSDPSPFATRLARQRFGIPTLSLDDAWSRLGKVDAVLLASPVGRRAEHHERLADCGSAVYLEKPIARSVIELDDLMARYEGSRVTCGFQRRSFANVGLLRSLLTELPVGPVRRIEFREGARTMATGASSDFRDDVAAAGGGILTDLGCHGLDTIDQLVGLDAAVVEDQELVVDEGVERDASLRLRAGDIEVVIELSWLRDIDDGVRVICENGVIASPARMLGRVCVEAAGAKTRMVSVQGAQNPTQGFWDAWCHALQLPCSDIDYSLSTSRAVVRITEDIYRVAGLR